MGLAEADTPIDEEGVVGPRRRLSDGARGGVSELVACPYHETLELIFQIEGRGSMGGTGNRGSGSVAGEGCSSTRCVFGGGRRFTGFVGLENDFQVGTMELVEGFVNDAGIVFVEPIAEMVIGNEDTNRVSSLEEETCGSKPGVETMLVDLGLDLVEYFFPEVHGSI